MKFFIVTCLKEDQDDVTKIFKQAKINAFSATDIIGFKGDQTLNLSQDWFASGDEKFNSVMIFSFTAAENAEDGMELVKKYNDESSTNYPVRAFIVPIEKVSY